MQKSKYFTTAEILLWCSSVLLISVSFFIFDGANHLVYAASLIGVTSLIFNAKGNPAGQLLMVIFSVMYGIISYSFSYYGEMITYLGMTGPMALFAFISWLRNPFKGNHAEVTVNRISKVEWGILLLATAVVTIVFYFILSYFNTANLILSTVSVTTSFSAVYLTFRRSQYFALAYALNDVVLIGLWILASMNNLSYVSVCICFVMFLLNDTYGYIAWNRMYKRQLQQD